MLVGALTHSALAQEASLDPGTSEDETVVLAQYRVGPAPDTTQTEQAILLDGATLAAPSTSASARSTSGITVTSPNGGETWAIGERVEISWTQTERADVFVRLYRGDGEFVRSIFRVSNTSGATVDWTLPPYLEPGDDYRIRVIRVDDSSAFDESDAPFRIGPGVGPYITVLSPFNGVTWEIGETVAIRWTSERLDDAIWIQLYYGPAILERNLDTRTNDDGEYLWTVPNNLEPRTDYYIAVRNADGGSVFDAGGLVTITYPGTTPLGNVDYPGDGWDVVVRDDVAFVGNYRNGLRTVDVSDPAVPTLLGIANVVEGGVRDIALTDDIAYTALGSRFGLGYGGVGLFGISDPRALTLRSDEEDRGHGYGIAAYGRYALLADDDAGLTVYDASNADNVRLVGSWSDDNVSGCRGVEV
ncbi:MAG: Ser-Thr-rich GPI-anchored membrane family protein, partial [Bacteroidota bacterium]